jgi:hypothetical protein
LYNRLICMIDYSDILSTTNHQTFFWTGTFQVWQKPKNVNFVYITCIGGGGGGGSTTSTSSNGGGGGGGGSSSITKILIQSNLLPDTLYVYVGKGGSGGVTAGNGGNGEVSVITRIPSANNTSDIVIRSGTDNAEGGFAGTTGSAGTGGLGGTVFTTGGGLFEELGIVESVAGDDGANGGAPGFNAGSTQTALATSILTGGGGGGGKSNTNGGAGGSILAGGVLGRSGGGLGGTTGAAGESGTITTLPLNLNYSSTKFPFATTGGAGGGGRVGGVAGRGGDAEIGSGGGGGGCGDGLIPARGGNGGNGIVIITAF